MFLQNIRSQLLLKIINVIAFGAENYSEIKDNRSSFLKNNFFIDTYRKIIDHTLFFSKILQLNA